MALQADNDMQGALDLLSTPAGNAALQQAVLARAATAHLTPDKTSEQLQQAGQTAGQVCAWASRRRAMIPKSMIARCSSPGILFVSPASAVG